MLKGNGGGAGIYFDNASEVNIKNLNITGFDSAFYVKSSRNIHIVNNKFSNNKYGIFIENSNSNIINNNILLRNK